MGRHVTNAGAFFAYVGRGMGIAPGVGSAFVSLVAYIAIQLAIFGFFGAVVGGTMNATFGIDLPWYAWTLIAWVLVLVLSLASVDVGAKLLGVLDDGYDLVTGRRAVRNDRFVKRNTSKIYNGVTAKVTGVPGKDFNSGFKVMTRELADSLEMYGELHRYIPVLAVWNGFKVTEVTVEHHERLHGTSKFGPARFWRGFLDLVTVKFLTTYTARPFHLFGGLGFVIGAVGSALLAWMLASKVTGNAIGTRPALQLGVLLVVVAVQMVSLGLLAELVVNLRRRRRLEASADGDLLEP